MKLILSRNDTLNLFTSMRKLLPSLLTQEERKSCQVVYSKLIKIIKSDFHKSRKSK